MCKRGPTQLKFGSVLNQCDGDRRASAFLGRMTDKTRRSNRQMEKRKRNMIIARDGRNDITRPIYGSAKTTTPEATNKARKPTCRRTGPQMGQRSNEQPRQASGGQDPTPKKLSDAETPSEIMLGTLMIAQVKSYQTRFSYHAARKPYNKRKL